MKQITILIMLLALVVIVGCSPKTVVKTLPEQSTKQTETTFEVKTNNTTTKQVANSTKTTSVTKTFSLTGTNYKFFLDNQEAPTLKVKKGAKVRIEFQSTQGFHDWVIDEFNAATKRVNKGGSTSVEFIASKSGTFEYYCSVGSHRQMGMFGKLIVE